MKEIAKKWGKELMVCNNSRYAGKVLCLDKGAYSSVHKHREKDETMLLIEGECLLVVGDRAHWLQPFSEPVHIPPNTWHMFVGLENSKIVEFSTEDKAEDTERRTTSKAKEGV